jgi:hypothetical protein
VVSHNIVTKSYTVSNSRLEVLERSIQPESSISHKYPSADKKRLPPTPLFPPTRVILLHSLQLHIELITKPFSHHEKPQQVRRLQGSQLHTISLHCTHKVDSLPLKKNFQGTCRPITTKTSSIQRRKEVPSCS